MYHHQLLSHYQLTSPRFTPASVCSMAGSCGHGCEGSEGLQARLLSLLSPVRQQPGPAQQGVELAWQGREDCKQVLLARRPARPLSTSHYLSGHLSTLACCSSRHLQTVFMNHVFVRPIMFTHRLSETKACIRVTPAGVSVGLSNW